MIPYVEVRPASNAAPFPLDQRTEPRRISRSRRLDLMGGSLDEEKSPRRSRPSGYRNIPGSDPNSSSRIAEYWKRPSIRPRPSRWRPALRGRPPRRPSGPPTPRNRSPARAHPTTSRAASAARTCVRNSPRSVPRPWFTGRDSRNSSDLRQRSRAWRARQPPTATTRIGKSNFAIQHEGRGIALGASLLIGIFRVFFGANSLVRAIGPRTGSTPF